MAIFHDLIAAFRDTEAFCMTDPDMRRRTDEMLEGTEVSSRFDYALPSPLPDPGRGTIRVEGKSSFRAAAELAGLGRTAVLNFANPVEPGGGVKRGAMAQEEMLCRSSNLYFSLVRPDVLEQYYRVHQGLQGYAFSDRLIYSPGVTVFKSDDTIPVLLEQPFRVDVITCAAPYCGFGLLPDLDGIFGRRIKAVLEAAIKREVRNLVLGAWGCGAFCNPPQLVADAFSRVLVDENYRTAFDQVVFAIKKGPSRNLAVFEQTFPAQQ